jgi:ATP-dependent DNA helicase RecQ
MAERRPGSLAALRAVSGVGEAKLERYGAAFLRVLQEHGRTAEAAKVAPEDEPDTYEATLKLVLDGHTPAAVAAKRGLKPTTIEAHLVELVRRGELTVQEATGLGSEELRRIERVWEGLREKRLRPLFEALDERYSFGVLRCVLSGLTSD